MARYNAAFDLGRYDFNAVSALCEAERCVRDGTKITILLSGIDSPDSDHGLSVADRTRIIGRFCALQDLYVGAWGIVEIVMAKRAMENMENGKRFSRMAMDVAVNIGWARDAGGRMDAACDWFDDWSVVKVTRALSSPDVYGVKYLKGLVYGGIPVCSKAGFCAVRA